MTHAEISLGRYNKTPDFAIGVDDRSIDVYLSHSFWEGAPDGDVTPDALDEFFDTVTYQLQRLVFSSAFKHFDGTSDDPINTLEFHGSGGVRSDFVKTNSGMVLIVLKYVSGAFQATVNLIR